MLLESEADIEVRGLLMLKLKIVDWWRSEGGC